MGLFRDDSSQLKQKEFLSELAALLNTSGTAQRLQDHIVADNERYQALMLAGTERHRENTERLARQDRLLMWILGIGASVLISTLSVLLTILLQGHST